ncbi:MAG: hypothetical protein IJT37_10590 [Lachnospiraceae bacterium]|nr:hypothetical protein [Lachnospiraceae bacterium]
MVCIEKQIFLGKQNIDWQGVEQYLKKYVGLHITVAEYGDEILIPGDFPDEYAFSDYTKRLRGGLAKTKANASQVIIQLIEKATNRRYIENKSQKHAKDAVEGWYRYDVSFAVAVRGENELNIRWNNYKGTLIVRIKNRILTLYDLINIKKEACKPLES